MGLLERFRKKPQEVKHVLPPIPETADQDSVNAAIGRLIEAFDVNFIGGVVKYYDCPVEEEAAPQETYHMTVLRHDESYFSLIRVKHEDYYTYDILNYSSLDLLINHKYRYEKSAILQHGGIFNVLYTKTDEDWNNPKEFIDEFADSVFDLEATKIVFEREAKLSGVFYAQDEIRSEATWVDNTE